MKKFFLVSAFFTGLFSFCLLLLYILAGVLYVFSNVSYPGDIAFIPKWIFLFSPMILLVKNRTVQEFLIFLEEKF